MASSNDNVVSKPQVVAAAPNDTGAKKPPLVRGRARVTGRVLNKYGQPIVGARVELQNTGSATKTRTNGDFTLDSLPSGTQTLEIRQLGFSPTEVAVELSAATPQSVTVKMGDYVPVLSEKTMVPRQAVLRTFLIASDKSYAVMPGGLTQVPSNAETLVFSLQRGGGRHALLPALGDTGLTGQQ